MIFEKLRCIAYEVDDVNALTCIRRTRDHDSHNAITTLPFGAVLQRLTFSIGDFVYA